MPSEPASTQLLKQVLRVEMLAYTAGCTVRDASFGRIITHRSYSILYDANLVLLRTLAPEISISRIEETVRPIFHSVGAHHQRFILLDPSQSERLTPLFLDAGYRHSRYLLMVHRRPAQRERNPEIVLHKVTDAVGHARLDQIEAELLKEVPYNSPIIRNMLRTRRRELCKHLDLTWYWAEMRRTAAGSLGLLREGPLCSIQGVSTRPNFRKRGVATTMVLDALDLAHQMGHTEVCLMTDEKDWPHLLYEQLGFESIGFTDSFVKDE